MAELENKSETTAKTIVAQRIEGTVQYYFDDIEDGFGLISRNDGKGDVSVDKSAIIKDDPSLFRPLKAREQVEFDVVEEEKGKRAVNVTGPGGVPIGKFMTAERRFFKGFIGDALPVEEFRPPKSLKFGDRPPRSEGQDVEEDRDNRERQQSFGEKNSYDRDQRRGDPRRKLLKKVRGSRSVDGEASGNEGRANKSDDNEGGGGNRSPQRSGLRSAGRSKGLARGGRGRGGGRGGSRGNRRPARGQRKTDSDSGPARRRR